MEPIPKLLQEPLLVFCVRLDGGADGGINFERRLRCIAGLDVTRHARLGQTNKDLALLLFIDLPVRGRWPDHGADAEESMIGRLYLGLKARPGGRRWR